MKEKKPGRPKTPYRPLCDIAAEILQVWGRRVHPYALPYLDAMLGLHSIHDKYYLDSAEEIVLRFLCNASYFRGSVARRLKDELRLHLKQLKRDRT